MTKFWTHKSVTFHTYTYGVMIYQWSTILVEHSIWGMKFQVLTAASMKVAVFWVVAPCSLEEVFRRFRGA
jgi:hypothetical protein